MRFSTPAAATRSGVFFLGNHMRHAITVSGTLAALGLFAAATAMDDGLVEERRVASEVLLAQHQAQQERREYMHRVSVCHRAFGPGSAPVEDEDGYFKCQSKRTGKTYVATN